MSSSNDHKDSSDGQPASTVVWHGGQVQSQDRWQVLKQRPLTVWLTGLSAAGKSTLAFALERQLLDQHYVSYVLDGDNIRHGLNKDLGFSPEDRSENVRRIAEVAHLMNDAGLIVITAFISPYRDDRRVARQIIGVDRFVEIYISTPLETCEARDPKGMYKRARAGDITGFTGVNAPYQPPTTPAMTIDTTAGTVSECAGRILAGITAKIAVGGRGNQLVDLANGQ
jgi:adenylyl-sulfate kinase